jgi:hypothetical protein
MSMQRHLYILLIVFLLHLLQKSPNWCLVSRLVICREYPNSKGEFELLMIDPLCHLHVLHFDMS